MLLEKNVGKDEAKTRIVATTDAKKGALRKFADEEGYATLVIADDVGGRYSVLSPVGLLPIAVAGIDIDALLQGAKDAAAACKTTDVTKNPALFYAAARNLLYRKGFSTEIFASFEPRLHYVAEWWKQLTGESEGKSHIGLFPASVDFTTDLHSMGQWIQQGRRNIIETFVIIDGGEPELAVPAADNDLDELGYLQGKPLSEVNHAAYQAHRARPPRRRRPEQHHPPGDPSTPTRSARCSTFFERAIGVSGYLMGINPFNQPGVEAYKTNMFALLGKPGFEQATKDVRAKLNAQPADTVVAFD